MSAGITIGNRFAATKKLIKEAVKSNPESVTVQAYSPYGTEYFTLDSLPLDKPFFFAGPDPYTKRNWYGSIRRTKKGVIVQ